MGVQATTWAPQSPAEKYGYRPALSGGGQGPSELSAVPTAAATGELKPWSPDNPLFWVAGIGFVTFGLMAFSTSVRVGGTTASVSIGDTK